MLRLIIILALFSMTYAEDDIRIIYSGNVSGYLEACNCPGNLFGGLIYADGVIDKLRRENINALFLDAGDLFPAANWEKNAEYAIEFYNTMQVTALNIGDQEFWFGKEYLLKQKEKAAFSFLSANIFQDESLLFKPYLLKIINNRKIAITGIVSKEAFSFFDKSKLGNIEIKPIDHVLPTLIEELKTKSDILILLSHCGIEIDKQIAKNYPEIDFIIGAHSNSTLDEPLKIGTVSILQAGSYAHYLGVLDIQFKSDKKYTYKHQLIKLKNVPVSAKAASLYEKFKTDQEAVLAGSGKKDEKNTKDYTAAPSAEECAKCHFDEYNQWARTPHANAWDTIKKDGRTNDKSCISCHTSLFEKDKGFVDTRITPDLVNITCVSCHTGFEGHSKEETSYEPVKEETCLQCHKPANSPDFTFKSYLPAVVHKLRYYTIKNGDWLSKLSKKYYYDIETWQRIFRANSEQILDPHKIYPGQRIIIPVLPEYHKSGE